MKRTVLFTIIAATLLMVGCGDDYLDVEPTEFQTADQIGEAATNNPFVATALISGVYSLMYTPETGGTTGDDDFGQKGYDIFTDMLTSDMALSGSIYGWYTTITQYTATVTPTFNINYKPWRYYYRIIRSCNLIIDANGGNDVVPETDAARWVMGQAKAMRAHSYFYLTQLYANSYNPSQEILPIYNSPDDVNGPKVTTQEIFDLIVDDLNDAIAMLGDFNRTGKHEVSQNIAKGILAYVYATMGNNAEAKTLTGEVIASGEFTLMDSDEVLGGFNDAATPGWMWGIDLTLDNGLDLVSWWGQVDIFTYSYAWAGDTKVMDQGLYDMIPADDVRKQQFLNNPTHPYHLVPYNKFYHDARVQGGQRDITTDYVYMRIAEMYLLNAEASAKSGDESGARNSLKALVEQRRPDASYIDGLSGQALLDEIYLQTRIELWGEGKTYFALKRNQRTTTRGTNHLNDVGQTLSYDDEKLTFEIPQAEIQDNPFINNQN